MTRRLYSMLVLLLVGSASLMAQADDPFPEVDTHKYADNMTIFGQVRQNGVPLADAVVAVYCGDELRGKGATFSQGSHTDIFYFQVWGSTNGEALVFRVSTGGQVFDADQGLTYGINAEVGSPDDYYYIDLASSDPGGTVVQTLTLAKGWNWVSGFLQEPLDVSIMAPHCSRIVSQTQELIRDPEIGMVGALTALEPGVGYKVLADEACTCTFSGHALDGSAVELAKGWNWIGYTLPRAQSVGSALRNLQAAIGDRLLGTDGNAEYGASGWTGTLTTLKPGSGYMYFRAGEATGFKY